MAAMLDFLVRPVRSVLGLAEHEVTSPLEATAHDIDDAVVAIRRATESIDHHVAVIENLATAVGPLADSVDRLNGTLTELIGMLAPMAKAEQDVAEVRHFFGRRRRPVPAPPAGGTPDV
jgi:hypothetical protein